MNGIGLVPVAIHASNFDTSRSYGRVEGKSKTAGKRSESNELQLYVG